MGLFQQLFGGKKADVSGRVSAALAAGATVVDVRGAHEFAGKHVPGAINIPHTEIGANLGRVGPKDSPVVLYCRSGARSGMAARVLRGAGYTDVVDVGAMSNFPKA